MDELDRSTFDNQAHLQRILAGDIEPDANGCILWRGVTNTDGYAMVWWGWKGTEVSVSRLVLETLVGPPPTPEHQAAHAPHDVCGNRHCVSVEHLRWATCGENQRDRVADGTTNRGEQCVTAELTAQQARAIRLLYSSGDMTQQAIADRFGISRSQVRRIGTSENWAWLDDETTTYPGHDR